MPFSSFHLHPDLLLGVRELGFTRPTPIQTDSIPPALEGRDVMACATTGSGKTAAFLLPIMHKLIARPRGVTRALILTPTRELAAQIEEHFRELAVHTPLSGAAVFGGVGMGPQEHAFRKGVDVMVATPGRLLDHFRRPYAKLSQLEFLVLDEADRMLDMGFIPDVRRILQKLPVKRQTLFFSATISSQVTSLARQMLRDPVMIDRERRATPAVGITQAVFPVSQSLKPVLLLELMKHEDMKNVLVFTRTKHRADRLMKFLRRNGEPAAVIHGDRSQSQRTHALEGFKRGECRVLVATDIASRGIDVVDLSHVVNFDVPRVPEDYVHRVGRTGRASATGDAFTLLSPEEEPLLRDIEKAISRRLPRVTLPGFNYKQTLIHAPMKATASEREMAKPARRAHSPSPVTGQDGRPYDGSRQKTHSAAEARPHPAQRRAHAGRAPRADEAARRGPYTGPQSRPDEGARRRDQDRPHPQPHPQQPHQHQRADEPARRGHGGHPPRPDEAAHRRPAGGQQGRPDDARPGRPPAQQPPGSGPRHEHPGQRPAAPDGRPARFRRRNKSKFGSPYGEASPPRSRPSGR